jgi:hypothetical protein
MIGTPFGGPGPFTLFLFDFGRAGAYDNKPGFQIDLRQYVVCPPKLMNIGY